MPTVDVESARSREQHEVILVRGAAGARMVVDGTPHELQWRPAGVGRIELSLDGQAHVAHVVQRGDLAYVQACGRTWTVRVHDPVLDAAAHEAAGDAVAAPMPGTVVAVPVAVGQAVAAGQVLMVIESMKMQVSIEARREGVVAELCRAPGETFERDAPLLRLRAPEA